MFNPKVFYSWAFKKESIPDVTINHIKAWARRVFIWRDHRGRQSREKWTLFSFPWSLTGRGDLHPLSLGKVYLQPSNAGVIEAYASYQTRPYSLPQHGAVTVSSSSSSQSSGAATLDLDARCRPPPQGVPDLAAAVITQRVRLVHGWCGASIRRA
jgi:hypothetical protein